MNIVGIIPARYASTRFPGKPLVKIKGKTMVQRVYEQAQKTLSNVCVATDDDRIFDEVKSFAGNVVMTNKDHPSGTDRCVEAIEKFEKKNNIKADVVINIQGDEPFIDPEQISQLVDLFKYDDTDIATLIKKVDDAEVLYNPNVVKVVKGATNNALYFSRSCIPYLRNVKHEEWIRNHEFYQHIGMYGYRRDVLTKISSLEKGCLESVESLEQLRWIENGFTIKTAITNIESVGIDTPDDLEEVLKKYF